MFFSIPSEMCVFFLGERGTILRCLYVVKSANGKRENKKNNNRQYFERMEYFEYPAIHSQKRTTRSVT